MVSSNILVKLSHWYEMNFSTFQTRKEKKSKYIALYSEAYFSCQANVFNQL